jgi:hypothetical protein
MPAKNTKPVKTYLTPAQIDALKGTEPGNIADLLRRLIKHHVEQNGGRWPESPGRGKYERNNISP